MQPFPRGDGCTQKISILHDIGNERGFTAQPRSPRQPDPGLQRVLAAGGLEVRDLDGFFAPHLYAAQHPRLAVVAPQRAQVPAEAVAHGPKYVGRGFFERGRLREDVCDRMLRHAAMLGPLTLGDVLHGAEHAKEPARPVPHHIALTADEAHLAVGPHHAVFHVVAAATPKCLGHCRRAHVTICGVE